MHNQPKQQLGTKSKTGCVMVWLEKRRFLIVKRGFLIVKRRFLIGETRFYDWENVVLLPLFNGFACA